MLPMSTPSHPGCRAAGILACWFVLYDAAAALTRLGPRGAGEAGLGLARVGATLLAAGVKCACICAPYALLQAQAYADFCTARADAVGLQRSAWCDAALPSLYGYVQKTYWDVGFLRFYAKFDRVSLSAGAAAGVGRGV